MSTAGFSTTEKLSPTENITKPSESDDSFFSAWLASPSQQQEAGRSPSGNKSPLALKHQSSKQINSASLKESKSSSSMTSSGDKLSLSEQKLHKVSGSEVSAVDRIKSQQKEAAHSQFQPISVSISDDWQAKSKNSNVAGLLISNSASEIANTSSLDHSELKFNENVPLDKGTVSDVGKNTVLEANVAVLVCSSSEDGTARLKDDHRVSLSAEPKLETSASSGHFNSQLSSSILSPRPDELLGTDEDILPESGWNDVADGDMWLSSAVDVPGIETEDLSIASVRTKLPDQLENRDVDFQCGKDGQNHSKDDVPSDIPQDTSTVLSAEVDAKVAREVPSLEGSMKEISSLEGSLEASADELSESNKTVVAEDSDLYCDDTDVDEMQTSGSTRSGIQQEHSMTVLSSELCSSSANVSETVDKEHEAPSGTDAGCQLSEFSATRGDDSTEAGETSPSGSSCVKNLLEEAMADSSTRDSSGSAEPARIESGGNSGHTSADEIDTTTSSDIEIISHTSSMNGRPVGVHASRPIDISPPRHSNMWNARTLYNIPSGQHRRSDSGSSAQSLQSRTDDEFASPDADHGRDYLSRASRDGRRHFAKSDPG